MRDTMKNSMDELMQFANNKPNQVSGRKYALNNLPEYDPTEIKAVRDSNQMTQKVFSDLLGVSVRTVEAWEAGRSHPNGSARRLIQLFEHKPELVEEIEHAYIDY